jgi:hypothetical protein
LFVYLINLISLSFHNPRTISANERPSPSASRNVGSPTVHFAMIIPNLIRRDISVIFANRPFGEPAELGCALVAEFVSALEFSLIGAGLLCPVLPHAIRATGTATGRLIGAGFNGIEPITAANPTLLPAMAFPPPAATVSSWRWIT